MLCEDVWAKYTSKDGASYVSYHRVWDKSRFLEARAAEAAKTGGTAVQAMRPTREVRK